MNRQPQADGSPEQTQGVPETRRRLFEHYRERRAREWIQSTGLSMTPLLVPGTMLLVEFGRADAKLGEIAIFTSGDTIVCHRVVSRARGAHGQFLTKGDAMPRFDDPVSLQDLLGVVVAWRRSESEHATPEGCAGALAGAIARLSYLEGAFEASPRAWARAGGKLLPRAARHLVEILAATALRRAQRADARDR